MVDNKNSQKESIKVLQECAELQIKKSQDYNNPDSRIHQNMYYPRGVATILDIVWAKVLRMYSVVEGMEEDPTYEPNFESLEDSAKDLINYSLLNRTEKYWLNKYHDKVFNKLRKYMGKKDLSKLSSACSAI